MSDESELKNAALNHFLNALGHLWSSKPSKTQPRQVGGSGSGRRENCCATPGFSGVPRVRRQGK